MRIPLIAGNWKMNKTVDESIFLVTGMVKQLKDIKGVEILICPPFTSLYKLADLLMSSCITLGAQNMHYEDKGAFTGEISPLMIKGLCRYVIIGHSERRQYFNDDIYVNRKIKAAIIAGIVPILCVGEKLEENVSGKTIEVLERQLEQALSNIDNMSDLVIAYEPIWAIGTGKTATGEQANSTIGIIRQKIGSLYNNITASNVRILYGGSVTADNITEFVQQQEIDGALVGGASLKPETFISIVSQTSEVTGQIKMDDLP